MSELKKGKAFSVKVKLHILFQVDANMETC